MYEYEPKKPKKKEYQLLFALLAGAAFLFGCSCLPFIVFPVVFQLLTVILLVGALMLASRCMLRRYVYRIAPREDADLGTPPDLTVTEYYGNHVSVVCRVSVADVESVTRLTDENRKKMSQMLRGKRAYQYTAYLWSDELTLLTVRDGDEVFYLRILADNELIKQLEYSGK